MAKKDDVQSEDTQQLPAVKTEELKTETHPESMISTFADKLESLMNQAVHASVPAPNQTATEHHQRFAKWANHLGDLWREVKQHA
jgi:hypothetical protein